MLGRLSFKSRVLLQVIATFAVIPFAYPLFSVIKISFGGQGPIANYSNVLTQTPFFKFLLNSVVISTSTIVAVCVITLLASFALSKLKLPGSKIIYVSLISGMAIPAIAITVPMFVTVLRTGLFNTYASVVIPLTALTVPFTILLTKNFMDNIPNEMIEAARIDGASNLQTLSKIVLPLSKPITAVVVIWSFLTSWNEYYLPLIFLQDENKQVVTQIPQFFTSMYGSDITKIFASLVLICAPIVIAYVALQKSFEKGLTAGAVK